MDQIKDNTNQTNTTHTVELPENNFDQQVTSFFSQKLIIAHLAKKVVPEYANMTIEEIIAHLDKEHPDSENHITNQAAEIKVTEGRNIKPDIMFTTTPPGCDKPIPIVINLEPQNKPNPGYPLVSRGIYYASRLISIQEHGENIEDLYRTLRKVYSIWICYNVSKNVEKNKNTVLCYEISEKALHGDPERAARFDYDKEKILIISLGDYKKEKPGSLLRLLDIAFSNDVNFTNDKKFDVLKKEYNINDAIFEEVKDLNAYLLDFANDYASKIVAERDAALAKADAAQEKANAAQAKANAVQKELKLNGILISMKRYSDLEKIQKDVALRDKLFLEFGLN